MSQMTLTAARELLGWTQSELARRADESTSNIRDLEQGLNANPSWALVSRVINALRDGGLKTIEHEAIFPVAARNARKRKAS